MYKLSKKSDTLIIVIHEIYGINPHIVGVCEKLATYDVDVICPNLIEREHPFEYTQEETAYRHFMDHVGFKNAFQKVKNIIVEFRYQYTNIFIIGFSVGATVAWLCSEEECVDGVVGYYGSRIRDFVNVTPKCPVLLFFPHVEKSFNVEKLATTLAEANTNVQICEGEHGFSDPYSTKYNEELAQITFQKTLQHFKIT
nr:dienelactone hydrolase family protein [Lysinibacillus timonensis]